jgi:hypothetical protein
VKNPVSGMSPEQCCRYGGSRSKIGNFFETQGGQSLEKRQ